LFYCLVCAKKAYKERLKTAKIEFSNKQTQRIKTQPIEVLKVKKFLTSKDTATLLNCSVRSVYHYIVSGTIRDTNLG
jgi:hypothetical protein